MIRWSVKTLLSSPLRLFASVLGVGLIFTLVVFFQAVFEGEAERIVAYPSKAGADVWVMQHGIGNMHMSNSSLWDWKAGRIRAIPGVRATTSILYMNGVVHAGDRDWFSYIVGLNPDAAIGGPWAMAAGKARPQAGEAVIPAEVAAMSGVGLGDRISIADKSLRVVGLSRETFSMANSVAFVAWSDLESIMDVFGSVSYVLVQARAGVDHETLAGDIEANVEKVNALPRAEFVASDRQLALQMGTEIIRIMTIVGSIVAALVVAFTAYAQVVHSQRELAVAKALGFRPRDVYLAAGVQTLIVAAAGVAVTVALSYLLLPLVPVLAPQIALTVLPAHLVRIGIAAAAIAALASLWPASEVARVDPMTVFTNRGA